MDAAGGEQLGQVLLAGLTEGQAIDREVVFQAPVAVVILAERVREYSSLDPSAASGDPEWRKATECVRG
ncbi:unnamed protein product [marine sediment metagenome]|uniref:Uncharacterized protein n=1 Tax=marine sediment metagenome TaxID=412755 RepID=X0UM68_9ZZZZ